MSDLEQRIAALPQWCGMCPEGCEMDWDAALARLALAREWIEESGHMTSCPWRYTKLTSENLWPACDCGFIELLAALEVPRG